MNKKIQKIIDPMLSIQLYIPILLPSNSTLFQFYTLPILHSPIPTLFQSYTLPILHPSNNPTPF